MHDKQFMHKNCCSDSEYAQRRFNISKFVWNFLQLFCIILCFNKKKKEIVSENVSYEKNCSKRDYRNEPMKACGEKGNEQKKRNTAKRCFIRSLKH